LLAPDTASTGLSEFIVEAKTKARKAAPTTRARKSAVAVPPVPADKRLSLKHLSQLATGDEEAVLPSTAKPKNAQAVAENTRKCGNDIVEAGWIFLPSTLVLKRDELGMDAVDLNILLVLLQFWWKADGLPFPTKQTIGNLVGIDPSNVRKRLAKLEQKGLITRTERRKGGARNDSNIYSFEGLIKRAVPFALELSSERRNSGAKSVAAKARRAATARNGATPS
jgi:DNA-binding transcriptional ArsR family regulator